MRRTQRDSFSIDAYLTRIWKMKPPSAFMSVLFPAPFSPTRARTSPLLSVNETPLRAFTPGKVLTILHFRVAKRAVGGGNHFKAEKNEFVELIVSTILKSQASIGFSVETLGSGRSPNGHY